MSLQVFSNNGSSLLASGIIATDTTVTVTPGEGAKFPVISAGQVSTCVLEDTGGNIEVVSVTSRTTDTMTIVRAQEGTTALAFASGSRLECRPTAGVAATFLQKTGGDTLSGTTSFTGILNQGSAGSIRGGEIAGTAVRGAAGVTGNQILVPADGTSPATQAASPILTVSNILAQLAGTGKGLMISGMVCFWSGASNAIPAGYVLCDGTAGTPDLRDQFIVGGGGALPTSGGSASTTTGVSSIGSLAIGDTALSVAQMPAHSHDFWASNIIGYAGNANPPFTIPMWESGGSGGVAGYQTNVPAGASGGAGTQIIKSVGGGATHTHTMSGSSTHSHTYTLPPYRAVFAIMKT